VSARTAAVLLLPVLGLAALAAAPVTAQESAPAPELGAFGERMVGTWEGSDSRHVFEWGVGERVLRSRSYAPAEEGAPSGSGPETGGGAATPDDGWTLVSEGFWYWDPAAEVIRGRTVAVGMGIDLFEYETRIEGSEVVHRMTAHGRISGRFVERWSFDEEGYSWTLEQDGERMMDGRYERGR